MAEDRPNDDSTVTVGTPVFDEDGCRLGTVRGFEEDGFFVTTREGIAAMSIQHEHPSHAHGEAELLWRCAQCGALGDIADLPETCPDCGAEAESIYYWTED